MQPTYNENDEVLVSSLPLKFGKPKVGDIVVFEKYNKYYIKRIKEVKKDKYFLEGDNKKDSQDSKRFGLVEEKQIKGKVIRKL